MPESVAPNHRTPHSGWRLYADDFISRHVKIRRSQTRCQVREVCICTPRTMLVRILDRLENNMAVEFPTDDRTAPTTVWPAAIIGATKTYGSNRNQITYQTSSYGAISFLGMQTCFIAHHNSTHQMQRCDTSHTSPIEDNGSFSLSVSTPSRLPTAPRLCALDIVLETAACTD